MSQFTSAEFVVAVQNKAIEVYNPGQSAPSFPCVLLAAAYEEDVRQNTWLYELSSREPSEYGVMDSERIAKLFEESGQADVQSWWDTHFPNCWAIINIACR